MKKLKIFVYGSIYIFCLMGIISFGNIFHEYSHYYQIHDIENVTPMSICALNMPVNLSQLLSLEDDFPLAYYHFSYKSNVKEEIKKREKYSELKAGIIGIIPYLFSMLIVFLWFYIKFDEEEEQFINEFNNKLKVLQEYEQKRKD